MSGPAASNETTTAAAAGRKGYHQRHGGRGTEHQTAGEGGRKRRWQTWTTSSSSAASNPVQPDAAGVFGAKRPADAVQQDWQQAPSGTTVSGGRFRAAEAERFHAQDRPQHHEQHNEQYHRRQCRENQNMPRRSISQHDTAAAMRTATTTTTTMTHPHPHAFARTLSSSPSLLSEKSPASSSSSSSSVGSGSCPGAASTVTSTISTSSAANGGAAPGYGEDQDSPVAAIAADLPDKINAMRRREVLHYCCEDYLSPDFAANNKRGGCLRRHGVESSSPRSPCATPQLDETDNGTSNEHRRLAASAAAPRGMASSPDSVSSSSAYGSGGEDEEPKSEGMNEEWREKMCQWSYQVVDHYSLDREIVAVSFSYLDRYVAKTWGGQPPDMKTYQLAAMSCLYLACKLRPGIIDAHSHVGGGGFLPIQALVNLSRGYFTPGQIAETELSILKALEWKVHPPTPASFVRHLSLLLPPNSCTPSVRADVEETARFFSELVVLDYNFVPHRPSSVALAALLDAIEGVDHRRLPVRSRHDFERAVQRVAGGLNVEHGEVEECRAKLKALRAANNACGRHPEMGGGVEA